MLERKKGLPSLKSVTYPIMIKLVTVVPYLKKIPKIYKSRDILLSSADTSILSPKIIKSSYIKKYRYRMHFNNYL